MFGFRSRKPETQNVMLDDFQKHYYRREFEVRFLRDKGNAFQELFRQIMEFAFPNDFIAVRTHGNVGDKKCDGFKKSEGIIYQCYAPKGMELTKLNGKIRDDFDGALKHWKDEMKAWVFVHNDDEGLPADSVKLLQKLEKDNPTLKTGQHGFQELSNIVEGLPATKLAALFGPVPTRTMIANIGNDDIRAAIHGLQSFDPGIDTGDPVAPSVNKLTANDFSFAVKELLTAGFLGAKRVQKFFEGYPSPDYVSKVAGAFTEEYVRLRDSGISSDQIYDALHSYANGPVENAQRRAAVLAVLSYFFERCDIFEDAKAS